MVCFNLYIFDRNGICVYYTEWNRPKQIRQGLTAVDEQKNLFGLLFQMNILAAAMDPKAPGDTNGEPIRLGAPSRIGERCSFYSFRTGAYKLHFFESPTGIKFALNTDNDASDLRKELAVIYESYYVEYVVKNPVYVPGQSIEFDLFTSKLNAYIKSLGL